MEEIVEKAITSVNTGSISFCKFITPNDTGTTGAHQSGFYIPKTSYRIFFDQPGIRGSNTDRFIRIRWQDDFETNSRAIYYGSGTRNEYRLTRFSRGFPFLQDDYVGSLLIIIKRDIYYYESYVLSTEEDIEGFLDNYGMSPVDTNAIIVREEQTAADRVLYMMDNYINSLTGGFPDTVSISSEARRICNQIEGIGDNVIRTSPDETILRWLRIEFDLFKKAEFRYYSDEIFQSFTSIDDFVGLANTILNRRKSRAGKSLEHHLDNVFTVSGVRFSHPGRTEGNRQPDFIFPSNDDYRNPGFSNENLIFLGAKTTCKDRWRQILNEADRIPVKHLFTLQQGISRNQLDEMFESRVILVVPNAYINTYPQEYRSRILNLERFIGYTRERQV